MTDQPTTPEDAPADASSFPAEHPTEHPADQPASSGSGVIGWLRGRGRWVAAGGLAVLLALGIGAAGYSVGAGRRPATRGTATGVTTTAIAMPTATARWP
jgi:uncharacterized protein HemX